MRTLLVIFLAALGLQLPATAQPLPFPISIFSRQAVTNTTAAGWRTKLGVGTGGAFTNASFTGGSVTGMTNTDLTVSRVMVSGATGIPTNSSVTSATLLFLDTASSVQGLLDLKASLTGLNTLSNAVSTSSNSIVAVSNSVVTVSNSVVAHTAEIIAVSNSVVTVSNSVVSVQNTLATNTALLNGTNVFAGTNRFAGQVIATNTGNIFAGDGSGLTGISGGGTTNYLYDEGALVGTAPTATNLNSVAIGANATTGAMTNAVAIGYGPSATGNYSVSIGYSNLASGNWSSVLGGFNSTASGSYSVAMGNGAVASGASSVALGGGTASATVSLTSGYGAGASLYGQHAHASSPFVSVGDAQTSVLVGRMLTTDGSATNLSLDGTSSAVAMTLANNTTWSFKVRVIARRTDATGENMDWTFDGLISRDANAASTALVGDVVASPRSGVTTAWTCTVTANTTAGSLQVNVTGEASKTIRWVARIETVEVSN